MAGKQEFTVLKGVCGCPWTSPSCGCPWTSPSLAPPTPCLSNSNSNKTLRNGKTAKIRVPSCMSSRQELCRKDKERKVAASKCCSLWGKMTCKATLELTHSRLVCNNISVFLKPHKASKQADVVDDVFPHSSILREETQVKRMTNKTIEALNLK